MIDGSLKAEGLSLTPDRRRKLLSVESTLSITLFGRLWPVAGLAAAVIVNLAWVGFLGYGFSKLVETAFF